MTAPSSIARPIVRFEPQSFDVKTNTVTGLASTWNLDHGGDVIRQGAYTKTLEKWRREQSVIPLVDSHRYDSFQRVVGKLKHAEETEDGLVTTFDFVPGDPEAEAAARRLKGGFVTGLSIGYLVKKSTTPSAELKAMGVRRIIDEVDLQEVSIVLFPMNAEAVVQSTSEKAAQLRSAIGHLEPMMDPDAARALRWKMREILDREAWAKAERDAKARRAIRGVLDARDARLRASLERVLRHARAS